MNPTYGYHEEQDLTVDTATLLGLTMAGDIGMAGNEVTGLPAIPSGGTAATSKTYVDNIASNIKWKPPVSVLDMISDTDQSGSDPLYPQTGDAYVVNNWSSQTDGDIVEWDGDSWEVIVANSGGAPPEGVRVGVADTSAAGSFTGQEADIATYNSSAASWSFEQPEDGWSVMVAGDGGVWEHNAFTYDLAGTQWILFSGAGQVVAGDGLTKSGNQLDVGAGNGIEVAADSVSVNLYSIDPGLEFNPSTGELLVKVDGAHGLILGSSGVEIELDDTPDTLDVDAAGLKVVGLPSLFKVNDVNVGALVTAANLDILTNTSNADALHYHAAAVATEAPKVEDTHLNNTVVAAGDVVRWSSTNDEIIVADNNGAASARAIGVARTGGAVNPGTSEVVKHGICVDCLSGATVNTPYFLGAAGALVLWASIPRPGRIVRMGYSANPDDLDVQIQDLGFGR
jgi:hypothetical protein